MTERLGGCRVGAVGPYLGNSCVPGETGTSSFWNKGVPAFQQDAASGGGAFRKGAFSRGKMAFFKKVHFLGEKWRFFEGGLLLVLCLE